MKRPIRRVIEGGGGDEDKFVIAGEVFGSRLIFGTGGAPNLEILERAIVASGTALVTVALRRVDAQQKGSVLDIVPRQVCTCFRTRRAVTRRATR